MAEPTVLESLRATHFRNLVSQQLTFGPGVHLLGGPNGAGKTNVLDAIYYLCLTRSHFSYGDTAAVAHGAGFFRLEGQFRAGRTAERIVLKWAPRRPKLVERNGAAYASLVEHVGRVPAVMISPADVELAIGGPEERRRFMDQTIAQYDHAYLEALVAYNRILKLRNAHLKDAGHPLRVDLGLLAAYDHQLLAPAERIHVGRRALVEALAPELTALYYAVGDAAEAPAVAYVSSLSERPFAEALMRSRDRDAYLGRTNVGPHRDDLELTLRGEPLKRFASQGQLKTFVLAMRLAQARLFASQQQRAPILLLDDIFDRLDPVRVQRLVDVVVGEHYAQVFVTDTHPVRLARLRIEDTDAHYYAVADGRVDPMAPEDLSGAPKQGQAES